MNILRGDDQYKNVDNRIHSEEMIDTRIHSEEMIDTRIQSDAYSQRR